MPETPKMVQAESISEMLNAEGNSWYFDEAKGWFHIKIWQHADRYEFWPLYKNINLNLYSFESGTVHKELTNDDEDYNYNANPYNKCSPEYGCPRMTWTVDLVSADENFECPIFDMPSKKGI